MLVKNESDWPSCQHVISRPRRRAYNIEYHTGTQHRISYRYVYNTENNPDVSNTKPTCREPLLNKPSIIATDRLSYPYIDIVFFYGVSCSNIDILPLYRYRILQWSIMFVYRYITLISSILFLHRVLNSYIEYTILALKIISLPRVPCRRIE